MIRHVELHLRQLSLAALTASPDDGDDESETDQSETSAPHPGNTVTHVNQPNETDELKSHELFTLATQGKDGLWHCPWEGEGYCDHMPSVLKADYE